MSLIPHLIPDTGGAVSSTGPPVITADPFSLYDVAINGIGFEYSSLPDQPSTRSTAPFERTRIDQGTEPGEQTLTSWWIKSQDSFHAGAGQLNIEPAIATPTSHIRYDLSKNVDVSTPGQVTRLPDTSIISPDVPTAMVAVNSTGNDCVVYIVGGVVKLLRWPGPVPATVGAVTESALAIATSGSVAYVATTGGIWLVDPANISAASKIASWPAAVTQAVVGWSHARLIAASAGSVYEVDVNATGITLGASQLLYKHPAQGWVWRAVSSSAQAILVAGDGGGLSTITQFSDNVVAGVPVLTVNGEIAQLPAGEKILSLQNVQGSFLGIGTTRGIRIGQYDPYYSRLTFGPLELLPTDPVIPGNAMVQRDRFLYVAGRDYDEAGLIKVDIGVQADAAGRYAWVPDLVTPTPNSSTATTIAVLTTTNKILFGVPGQGIVMEGTGPGQTREAWLRTSRIRWGTTEPKLFKLGRLRGLFQTGTVKVTGITPAGTQPIITVGFVATDPDEFKLLDGKLEWLQLRLDINGANTVISNYAVKALPGTTRFRDITMILAMYDSETTKSGQRIREPLGARSRLNQLEALDAAGDIVLLQEFTPAGVVSTHGVIQHVKYSQIGRPTKRADLGGQVEVTIRTVS